MKLGLSMALFLASLTTTSPVVAAALGAESIVGVWRLFEGDAIRIRTQVIVSIVDGRKRTFTLHLRRVK